MRIRYLGLRLVYIYIFLKKTYIYIFLDYHDVLDQQGARASRLNASSRSLLTHTRAWLDYAPVFGDKIDALGQNAPQSGSKRQGGGGITAYVVGSHAPDGAPTVGAARIGRGAVLERRVAT
jgi:hypothetical protein